MSVYTATSIQTFVGYLDLTGQSRTVNFGPLTRQMKDSTTMADGGYSCVLPGLINGEMSLNGYNDWTADVLDDELSVAQLGSQYPVTVAPNTSGTATAGDPCWLSRGVVSTLSPLGAGTIGEVAGLDLSLPYDTVITRGQVAHPKAARTSDGNGTALTLTGPTAAQKLYAALHVTAYSGFTNVVFKIQSDDGAGFGSATDRITFATVTARTSEWASVAGSFSSETHHRITWDVTGSGSVTFYAAVGVL